MTLEFDFRANQNLQRIKNIGILYPYEDIPFSPIKISVSLFLAEFLLYATKLEQKNLPLFYFVYDSLVWFDGAHEGIANFICCF